MTQAIELTKLRPESELERIIARRRTVRDFARAPVAVEAIARLLWAAQGMTDERGLRAAPSAGALYPLELYCMAGDVEGLRPGLYHYRPHLHALTEGFSGDRRAALADAAINQPAVREAPAVLVFVGVFRRTQSKYGPRGARYVHMEAGHAAQNVYLQAAALGLATAVIGAIDEVGVQRVLLLPDEEEPLYLMPVGRAA